MSSPEENADSPIERVETEIDFRLADLILGDKTVEGVVEAIDQAKTKDQKLAIFMGYMRACYGRAYIDALTEPVDEGIAKYYENRHKPKDQP